MVKSLIKIVDIYCYGVSAGEICLNDNKENELINAIVAAVGIELNGMYKDNYKRLETLKAALEGMTQ